MKNIVENFTDFIKNNQKKAFVLVLVVLISTIGLIVYASSRSGLENEKDSKNNITVSLQTPVETAGEETQTSVETSVETLVEDALPLEPVSTGAEEVVINPEKIVPKNTSEDPQKNGTSGVAQDSSVMKAPSATNEIKTYGIDVSKWQGIIDWKQVKASGVDFVMIRVGYRSTVSGVITEDDYARYNLQQAKANGIKIGAYFFSTAINTAEAKEEAAWVAKFIGPYPITYPVAFNCEGFNNTGNRQYGLGKDVRTNIAIAFLDEIKSKGYKAMFYASKSEMEQNAEWNATTLGSKYQIWVAQYPNTPYTGTSKSSYSGKVNMWQYTNKGNVPGISKPVDFNVAYFGYKEESKAVDETPQEIVTPDPVALIDFKAVNDTVTAKNEVALRSLPSQDASSTVVATLKNGDTAKRLGTATNGWSKIEYAGKVLYAVDSYLTNDLTYIPGFTTVNNQVTAKEEVNLRSRPSTDSDSSVVGKLSYGEIATRTGVSDNGWSRLSYNGKTVYVKSNIITTDLNYQVNKLPTLENPENGIVFTKVNEEVTAIVETNLRLVPTTAIADTIVVKIYNGDLVIRTGVGDNGWSRVVHNGQTLYAVTKYLTVTGN